MKRHSCHLGLVLATAVAVLVPAIFTGSALAVTAAPSLLAPTSSMQTSSPLLVSYNLPELALVGTARLTFTKSGTAPVQLTLNQITAGAHEFTLNTADVESSSGVSAASSKTIPDGLYILTLSYQDVLADPAASASALNVSIDTATLPPSLSAPTDGSVIGGPFNVEYTLPEVAHAASVVLVFAGEQASTTTLILPSVTAGAHIVSIDPLNLGAVGVVSSGAGALTRGSYTLTVRYQDALGNPVASSNPKTFSFPPPPAPPVLVEAPTQGSGTLAPTPVPVALGPVPVAPASHPVAAKAARLSVRWRITGSPRARVLRATFTPVAASSRYSLTLTRGRTAHAGRCHLIGKGRHRRVACTVSIPRAGRWLATAKALGAGRTLAVATRPMRAAR